MSGEIIREVNEDVLRGYFARLDPLVSQGTTLFIFGGGAVALLGAKIRTTIDLDVAGPYSRFAEGEFCRASQEAGLPVNPPMGYQGAYVELVGKAMLAMPSLAEDDTGIILYRGNNLTVKTGSAADLVASKLCRYSEQDVEDIQFLVRECGVGFDEVARSVQRLFPRLRSDVLVRENLSNLELDMKLWEAGK